MSLNFDHMARCIHTLEESLVQLDRCPEANDVLHEIFRNAVIKGFELTLEVSGKLLRKALQEYAGTPGEINKLVFKDVFRRAAFHGLMTLDEVERWFIYRDSRNNTAHDYGELFANKVLEMIRAFVVDAKRLHRSLEERHGSSSGA
ncbi:MAG: nucleotidyltransferase substrate binding protein [Magnetococcales bacterium]|nr:nucleotidyltransferase substrate binding protein [Magnetococcales bacterium]